jgi:hypothetical protein
VAESDLSGILTREHAGGIGEIRDRVNTASNPEDQQRALKALDEWMDRQQDLKKANEELVAAAKAQADENERGFEESRAAAEKYQRTLAGITAEQDREREQARDQATARANYAASVRAVQLELAGRKDLADQLRQQVDLLGQVSEFARSHGVSEEEALKLLRNRLGWEERLKKLREDQKNNPQDQPGSPHAANRQHSMIYTKDSALHDDDGARFQGVGARHIGLRSFEIGRRHTERATRNGATKGDASSHILLRSLNIQEEMLKVWQKLNVV